MPPELVDEAKVRKTEVIISMVLRVGVVVSVAVVVSGLVLSFVGNGSYRTSPGVRHAVLHGHSQFPHSIGTMVSGLAAGQGRAIVSLGLLLLLLTPVMRVAVSIFTFLYQHDRTFVIVTSFVLTMLIVSFFLGTAGG